MRSLAVNKLKVAGKPHRGEGSVHLTLSLIELFCNRVKWYFLILF